MIKVALAADTRFIDEFEDQINTWIKYNPNCKVIDVKFSTTFNPHDFTKTFSGLVVYIDLE